MGKSYFMVVVAALLMLGALVSATSVDLQLAERQQFHDFLAKHGKTYAFSELGPRFEVFKSNLAVIDELNAAKTGAHYGVTKFADLTAEEFRSMHLNGGKRPGQSKEAATPIEIDMTADLPDSFDWRDKKAVTPAKDQGQCGSCWAFSVTEAIESAWFLTKGQLPVLAPQQIVDCDLGNGDLGCSGGDTPTAYAYVQKAGGLDTEESYPYTGEDDGKCSFNSTAVAAKISGFAYITKTKNETEMQYGLVAKGPLSICVDASSWQYYIGGVISGLCYDTLDHCVMITGYGQQTGWDQQSYQVWNIRNSWGESWGYDGYLYVERNYELCGVGDEVTVPLI